VSYGGEERDVEGGGCRESAIPGLRLALRLALVFGSHQVKIYPSRETGNNATRV
jgi:hypothetical protein